MNYIDMVLKKWDRNPAMVDLVFEEYSKVKESVKGKEENSIHINDMYRSMNFFYQCVRCGQQFSIWWAQRNRWLTSCKKAGWDCYDAICKDCFEDYISTPNIQHPKNTS